LRMSQEEIKQEYKQTKGDPQLKGEIKRRQRSMAMRRMMEDLKKADVVITNPTHYAVGIKYDPLKFEAPFVVAKGQNEIAFKIKEIAQENDIVIMENKPLARALYAQVDLGQVVPSDLYKAVAEVIAFVYKLKKKSFNSTAG
ncbi:MAG: EscU/YscU/HrcU family type III secretion system export apparatus switch protein, partial [Eubacteriales bacterium]